MRTRNIFLPVIVLFATSAALSWGQGSKPQTAPRNGGDFSDNIQSATKVPSGVILVKGAWSSASDNVTPLPEGGSVSNGAYHNQYFEVNYPLPPDWIEKYKGPPPSDSGRYVLAQIGTGPTFKGSTRGTILITAQDMFFTPLPAASALELVNYSREHLQADYQVEMKPTATTIADRPFTFFAYWSPAAQLHWYVMATEIRCHAVEIILTSRDTKLLESLVLDLNKMRLPEEANPTAGRGGGAEPVCIKDYAREENMIARVDPVFTEHRFNPVPVRIVIDKQGKVKHIHFLSAFPDQAKVISDALGQWRFKRHLQNGQVVEVETGVMFGRAPRVGRSPERAATE
jgi:hypothetical protein